MDKFLNLVGQRYGKLIVLKREENTKYGSTRWLCQCDCGKQVIISGNNLRTGNTITCGCSHVGQHKGNSFGRGGAKDLLGHIFGRWTVLEKTERRYRTSIMWLCRCTCGTLREVRSSDLLQRKSTSCGCLSNENRRKALTTHGKAHTPEYSCLLSRQRRERKRIFDSQWTFDMELALKHLFPTCVVCGLSDRLCVDHVKPLIMGYGLCPGNAVILCVSCNSKKRSRLPNELPDDMRIPILNAAQQFKDYWKVKWDVRTFCSVRDWKKNLTGITGTICS